MTDHVRERFEKNGKDYEEKLSSSSHVRPRITLFTCPKPFTEKFATLQAQSLRSWTLLQPPPDHIYLLGGDKGVHEIAVRFNVSEIASVRRNEYGTPFLDDIVNQVLARSDDDIFVLINNDILTPNSWMEALQHAYALFRRKFLIIGQRFNVPSEASVEVSKAADDAVDGVIRKWGDRDGRAEGTMGIDYFAFTRGVFDMIPPFALGRFAWDNWLVHRAVHRGATVVDLSQFARIIHPRHDYSHLPGSQHQMDIERDYNYRIGKYEWNDGTTENAKWLMKWCGQKNQETCLKMRR